MAEPARLGRRERAVDEPFTQVRDRIAGVFGRVEDVVYIGLGSLLAISAIVLLGWAVFGFVRQLAGGEVGEGVISLLDRLLLVMMIVEILYTVQVSFREHTLAPEPFLVVGLIAATRRILIVTAEFADPAEISEPAFRNAMIELGLLTLMVLVLVVSLAVLRRLGGGRTAVEAQRS
jgi:uncharacterized membrane protein (DUF373 family)